MVPVSPGDARPFFCVYLFEDGYNFRNSGWFEKGKSGWGVVYEITQNGTGKIVLAGGNAKVKSEGRLAETDEVFDQGRIPFKLGKGEVIGGWDTGVVGMQVGEKRILKIPTETAYGQELPELPLTQN